FGLAGALPIDPTAQFTTPGGCSTFTSACVFHTTPKPIVQPCPEPLLPALAREEPVVRAAHDDLRPVRPAAAPAEHDARRRDAESLRDVECARGEKNGAAQAARQRRV